LPISDIKPDKSHKSCAFWYKGLTLPDEIVLKDPNCCFTYKKSKKEDVFICSTHKTRCIYHAKMMLKRLRTSCLEYEAEHKMKGLGGGGL
jgi:hypothetical protein